MRVLVIEDNQAMADAIKRGLLAEGFDVDVANDGVDGLWQAREFTHDAIVLDIMLPGVNGYELCRTIRAEGNNTPVLMLTAKDGEYDIAEGLELGADDYLTKPFSFVVLVARIRALVRRANPAPSDATITIGTPTLGTLTIDTRTRRCCLDGKDLELTPREYTLLETLARRHGQPMTRTELLDHVWGFDNTASSNVVDVYIGYLRKKLQPAGSETSPNGSSVSEPSVSEPSVSEPSLHQPSLIETVRGVGYRIGRIS